MEKILKYFSEKAKKPLIYWVISLILLALLSYGGYLIYDLHKKNIALQNRVSELEMNLKISYESIESMKIDNETLTSQLQEEKNLTESLQDENRKITRTVNTLEKLTETDPELLKKYSKVYFLNEHYTPEKLVAIDEKYLYNPKEPQEIHSKVRRHLDDLLEDAEDDDIMLKVASAYRSFEEQTSLKSNYKVVYGTGANQFSADQGYSEHQLGTAVDFAVEEPGAVLTVNFEKTAAYEWLTKNAYKYGFVLSYPKGNSYYQFEPWHWRFVGDALARKLRKEKKFFYDLDQREIDAFLVKLFD